MIFYFEASNQGSKNYHFWSFVANVSMYFQDKIFKNYNSLLLKVPNFKFIKFAYFAQCSHHLKEKTNLSHQNKQEFIGKTDLVLLLRNLINNFTLFLYISLVLQV